MFSDLARKYFRFLLEPIARFFGRTGISPNFLTVLGFLLVVVVAVIIGFGHLFWSGILLIVAVIFDAVDGTLARMMDRTSRFGAFLDSTLDRYAEAILYFGLFYYFSTQGAQLELMLIYATIIGSLMVSYARARAEGIDVALKDGLLTRFERLFLFIVALLFSQYLLLPVLWFLAIFTNFTAIQRIYMVWRITGGEQGG